MKAKKFRFSCTFTKALPNYENVKIMNELEVELEKGDKLTDVHKKVKETVNQLNAIDLQEFLDAYNSK